jgi:hypothetical protein
MMRACFILSENVGKFRNRKCKKKSGFWCFLISICHQNKLNGKS